MLELQSRQSVHLLSLRLHIIWEMSILSIAGFVSKSAIMLEVWHVYMELGLIYVNVGVIMDTS